MAVKDRLSIKKVLNSILQQIEDEVKVLWANKGVPKNSDLLKSIEVKNQRNTISVFANEYYQWLDSGRKKFAKKIPISAILYWIKHYKIRPNKGLSVNQLAYIFQTSIYLNGIRGRKFLVVTEKTITKIMQKELEKFYVTEIENGIIQTIERKIKK